MSIILALPAQKLVINAFTLFTGTTPSNAAFSSHVAYIGTNGEAAYISFLNTVAKDIPIATLASNMLTNLGLTAVFTQEEAVSYLTARTSDLAGAMSTLATATLNYVSNPDFANNAQMLLAKTAWNNTATNALAYSSATTSTSPGSLTATAAGTTFTLTTGVDAFVGTGGADSFNATNLTLNSFDSLAGGLGTDSLSYADASAANFALPLSTTFSGFETILVARNATGGGTGAVVITDTTFGTGVKSLTYNEATVTGSMTAATVAITLNSAEAVSVVAGGTGVFDSVAVTDTSATTTLTGSSLKAVTITGSTLANTLTGNAIATVNLNNATVAVTTVTAAAGTRELTVNTAGTGGISGVTDATATTLNLNNTGIQALGTFTTAAATTVNVNTTAAATGLVVTAAAATTLNISGTATVAAVITGSTALTAINISGAGAGLTSVVDLSGIATGLTAITSTATSATATAAGNTLGATTVTAGFGTGVTFTGGAGNDTITVGATTKTIDVGAGSVCPFVVYRIFQ
jgi:hypothetical protein